MDAKNKYGATGFILACRNNQVEIVDLLIQSGVNMEVKNNDGDTGFILACRYNHIEIINLFIQFGMVINTSDIKLQETIACSLQAMLNYFCDDYQKYFDTLILFFKYGVCVGHLPKPKYQHEYGKGKQKYFELKEKCKIEIEKCISEREMMKNIWLDVDLIIIDAICAFSNGQKNLERVVKEMENLLF
jgi:hypothetical protein